MKNNQILIKTSIEKSNPIKAKLSNNGAINNTSYPPLTDKPRINEVILLGNKTSEDLGLQERINLATKHDIDKIIYGIGGD